MSAWVWLIIAVVVIVVIAAIVWAWRYNRSKQLRSQFGPEYNRQVERTGSRMQAESELSARRDRVNQLEIRPLDPAVRSRYADRWKSVQARFVDQPAEALTEADELVVQVMTDRGYPVADFERRAADVSVDHASVVENYRNAHDISMSAGSGNASTEEMRQGMVDYRALFSDLLGDGTGMDMREAR
jgi:hypothetical protein